MANYIVEMDSGVHADASAASSAITGSGASITTTFSLSMTYLIDATADQLAAINGVKYSADADADSGVGLQSLSTHHFRYLDNRFSISDDPAANSDVSRYEFGDWEPKYSGNGKTIYLVDSGINASHTEFANATITNLHTAYGTDYADSTGHGTSMAGLMVGRNIGVAREATVKNIKLFNEASGNVTLGNVINALDAVLTDHNSGNVADVKVMCAPWTTSQNNLIDSKIGELNSANIVVVAAAGNQNDNVANYSPAGVDDIITVGSHDNDRKIASFTNTPWDGGNATVAHPNYGAQVDIFSIGVDVTTCSHISSVVYGKATGTSMSTALVAGGAAAYIEKHPSENSNKIKEILISEGSIKGKRMLTLDTTGTSAQLTQINQSLLMLDSGGTDETLDLSNTYPSGKILNVQRGQTANVDLDINTNLSNISIVEFSPLPPFATWSNVAPHVVTVDVTSLDANLSPANYVFGVRGTTAKGYMVMEEFTIGIYNSNTSELDSASSYYYDAENTEYDLAESVDFISSFGRHHQGQNIK